MPPIDRAHRRSPSSTRRAILSAACTAAVAVPCALMLPAAPAESVAVVAVTALAGMLAASRAREEAAAHAVTDHQQRGDDLQVQVDELERLAAVLMPALADGLARGESPEQAACALETVSQACRSVLDQAAALLASELRRRHGATDLFGELAERVLASVSSVQGELTKMQAAYASESSRDASREAVSVDLQRLDHQVAGLARRAKGFAVLAAVRAAGRQWPNTSVERVIRAAIGSVTDWRRVQWDHMETEVAGAAVAALIHVLGELLDNALAFSAPTSSVAVRVRHSEQDGLLLDVRDGGLGMSPQSLAAANELLSRPFDLLSLSSNRLGLAAARRLAAPLGITVTLTSAPGIGTTATVSIPHRWIAAPPRRPLAPADRTPVPAVPAGPRPAASIATAGLPVRQPGGTLPDASSSSPSRVAPAPPPSSASLAALSRFHAAARGRAGQDSTQMGHTS